MKGTWKIATAASVAGLLAAGSALGAQNVANTNQKGSLLIFPLINIDQRGREAKDTIIEISNDGTSRIHVECLYVNERKDRANFDFHLTGKQTVSWDVLTQDGDQVQPVQFPTDRGAPPHAGNPFRGILVCFATNQAREFQVAWNHLTGTATVINLNDRTARQSRQGFKYNAWAFAARNESGLAPDNNTFAHGEPGRLELSGANAAGAYDGCPAYNIANFMPNGARLGNLATLNNNLSIASCNQDLRETYNKHNTKLEFTVWNSFENSFTGAHVCVDSVATVALGEFNRKLEQGSNFDFSTVRTPNARFQVRGVSATPPCPFQTEVSGLLGVLESEVAIAGSQRSDASIGDTLHGAGVLPGYVLWDPAPPVQGR